MLLADVATTAEQVAAVSARGAKVDLLAARLREASPEDAAATVAYLSGRMLQRQIGVGWAALRDVPAPAAEPSLSVLDVDAAFEAIGACGGAGSTGERRRLLAELFGRATAQEQAFLRAVLSGELRQGAQEGVMADAVARAAGLAKADVRRALMLRGDLPAVAALALDGGAEALAGLRLEVGRPLLPMLAGTAPDVAAALERTGPAGIEWKLDGARIQVHRSGDDVGIFTRSLDDITARLPEIVAAARALPVTSIVLDGEAIALRPDGRPYPFQVTASRIGSRDGEGEIVRALPLSAVFFDVLHLDGEDLLDHRCSERAAALERAVPGELRVRRAVPADADEAAAFMESALAAGHEGVMVKSLEAPYEAGRRGTGWIKVKPVHTLDLVVLAVEWGHGRRQGTLSNLHLGARDPAGGFVMLGKTFKGLTDAMLAWQTQRLLELEVRREGHVVYVRPELVVEIAFDGVQASTRYPGGVALRFARVKGYREDKQAEEADTIDAVRAIHAAGGGP